MKKLVILTMALCVATSSFSQDLADKEYKNEIGFDLTPLVKQFLTFNDNYYTPDPFYLMYRRHLGNTTLRAGIGGSHLTEEQIPDDTTTWSSSANILDFRLGIEKKTDFAKKWQFFYGLDLFTNIFRNQRDYQYSNAGQAVGFDDKTTQYGLAPLLGLRFKLNERLCLTTETSYRFYSYNRVDKTVYDPDTNLNTESKTNGTRAAFNAPTSVFITFDF